MSVYRCNRCEGICDADYPECFEDKKDLFGLLCCECDMMQEKEEEDNEDTGS